MFCLISLFFSCVNKNGGVNRFDKHAQVKLDHFPNLLGKHKQYLKPPPSLDSFPLFLVGKNLLQGTGHHPREKNQGLLPLFWYSFQNANFDGHVWLPNMPSRLSSLLPLLHQCCPLRMHGIRLYIFAYMKTRKINGIHVGIYTSPMDPMGLLL